MYTDQFKDIFIDTHMNKKIYFMDPKPENFCIEDIAHALSNICRFNGHCDKFYSVAVHSIFVSDMLPREISLHGLLHDAPEAYVTDIPRPLKKLINWSMEGLLKKIEYDIHHCINRAFNLRDLSPHEVKQIMIADNTALWIEAHILKPNSNFDEWAFGEIINDSVYLNMKTNQFKDYISINKPKEIFLETFNHLKQEIKHG